VSLRAKKEDYLAGRGICLGKTPLGGERGDGEENDTSRTTDVESWGGRKNP